MLTAGLAQDAAGSVTLLWAVHTGAVSHCCYCHWAVGLQGYSAAFTGRLYLPLVECAACKGIERYCSVTRCVVGWTLEWYVWLVFIVGGF